MVGKQIAAMRKKAKMSKKAFSQQFDITPETLDWWETTGTSPDHATLQRIAHYFGSDRDTLLLSSGHIPPHLMSILQRHPEQFMQLFQQLQAQNTDSSSTLPPCTPIFQSQLGTLYQNDCLQLLPGIDSQSIDCIFADPPFNLGKDYGQRINDLRTTNDYMEWSQAWLDEAIRVLKPGGTLFVYNLPKWNIPFANHLNRYLEFKHWISIDIKFSMPIPNRLYPSHYSLLYFVKGKRPKHFNPPRLPIQTCRHCGGEHKDYGGHKGRLNPLGLNLTDVWLDIPPVRHKRYKNRSANQLSLKLLNRVLDIATQEGDLVLDPFGGSGTTFAACELKKRRWVGCEMGDVQPIITRMNNLQTDAQHLQKIQANQNCLFTPEALKKRNQFGHDSSRYKL